MTWTVADRKRYEAQKHNKHWAVSELNAKSQMQQTLHDVLKQLNEWEYSSELVTDAENLLRAEKNKLERQINKLMDILTDGEFDPEKALEGDRQ